MIEICNMRNEKPVHPWDMKVDRSSVLGNPFKSGTRESQCKDYAETFEKRVKTNSRMRNELRRLWSLHQEYSKLRLFCWCAPKQCHSETIKDFLDQYI